MSNERSDLQRVPQEGSIDKLLSGSRPSDPGRRSYNAVNSIDLDYADDQSKIDLRKMYFTLRRRKWLILGVVFIMTTIVAIYAWRAKSVYQASATIEIAKDGNARKLGDLAQDEELADSLYLVNIKTKMLGLQSPQLHEDVITDLKLDQYPKFLEVRQGNFMKSGLRAIVRSVIGKTHADNQMDLPQTVTVEATGQPAGELVRSLEERTRLEPFVQALEDNLEVEQVRDTQAVRVSFTHTNPTIAAAVANSIAQRFVRRNFSIKTEKFTDVAEWLERSTDALKTKVEQAEQALANYTREHNMFSIEGKEDETLTTTKLAHLHDLAMRAETDCMLKQNLYEEVKAGRIEQLPDAFTDPKLTELHKHLNELQTEVAQLRVKYASKNPRIIEAQQQIIAVQEQIHAGRKALEEKLKTDYERAVKDQRSLSAALSGIKAEAVQENQAAIQYNILKQDAKTARSLYTDFLQKTSQANLRIAEQQKSTRVISSAQVPLEPAGPKRLLMVSLGFMASLVIGIGLAFLVGYLDQRIKSIEDVNRYVQLRALGVIPVAAGRAPQLVSARRKSQRSSIADNGSIHQPAESSSEFRSAHSMVMGDGSPMAEAYRVLRTSVLLSCPDNEPRTILITSSQPGEGKTTTAVNTAISLAQLGRSVLIIDCDLRTPMAHNLLGVDKEPGLSTYLTSDAGIDDVIQKLQMPNLSLLASGPIPSHPSELISTNKMKDMLLVLAERYDHILIDSPPLINLADPLVLSRLVDGVILVVHGGKSTRDAVLRAREELLGVGAEIFGVVLNSVELESKRYGGQYYYKH